MVFFFFSDSSEKVSKHAHVFQQKRNMALPREQRKKSVRVIGLSWCTAESDWMYILQENIGMEKLTFRGWNRNRLFWISVLNLTQDVSKTLLSQACLPQSYCTVKLSCSCCKRAKIPHAYPKQNTSIGNHLHAWKKERNIWKTLSKILWHLPLQTKNDTSPRSTDDSFSLEFAVPSCFMNWKSFRACILWERQWKRIWTQGNILTCHFSTLGVHSVNSFREIS